MSVQSLCRELLAAFIAKELDILVAEPVVIDVSKEFVETLVGHPGYRTASNSIGLNFGCQYIEGLLPLTNSQPLNDNQYTEAVKIFALDVFISNADRNINKPNAGTTDGNNIVIFDHELAFGFVMDIIKNNTPWIFSEADKGWIKNHYFYSVLMGSEHDFEGFVDMFDRLDNNFWSVATSLIPSEWHCSQINEIQTKLVQLVENKSTFLDELNKITS